VKGGWLGGGDLRYKVSMGKGGETMGKVYLANAFSLSMLSENEKEYVVHIKEISKEEVKEIIKNGFFSAIGHESTSLLLSEILETKVELNRSAIQLKAGDILIVFQLLKRLPEGKILTKEEISQIPFKFYILKLIENRKQ